MLSIQENTCESQNSLDIVFCTDWCVCVCVCMCDGGLLDFKKRTINYLKDTTNNII